MTNQAGAEFVKQRGKEDLFFFAKYILGNDVLREDPHKEMAKQVSGPEEFKLLLWPRDTFKSLVATQSYVIWRIIKDPDIRILITNSKLNNAQAFLGYIKAQFESNTRLRRLYSNFVDEDNWTKEYIRVSKRSNRNLKEHTVEIGSTGSSKVSRHYDLIIADDLINRDWIGTDTVVDQTITYWKDLQDLKAANQPDKPYKPYILVIGTRWSHHDLYGYLIDEYQLDEDEECDPRWVYSRKEIVEDGDVDNGELLFPKRYPRDKIKDILRDKGFYEFSCFPKNTPVLTKTGTKDIQEVQIGEQVLGHDREWHDIQGKHCHKQFRVLEIDAYGLSRTLRVTPNHPLFVQRSVQYRNRFATPYNLDTFQTGSGNPVDLELPKPEWVPAEEIEPYDVLVCPIDQKETSVSGIWEDPSAWYLLGRWLAEGSFYRNAATICAGLSERELIEKDAEIVKSILDRTGSIYEGRGTFRLTFSHPEFTSLIYQAYQGQPGQKILPYWCEQVPDRFVKSLLRGYWTGDGYIRKDRNSVNANSACLELLEQFQRMFWKLGSTSYISKLSDGGSKEINGRKVQEQPLYNLSIHGTSNLENALEGDLTFSRSPKCWINDGYVFYRISDIDSVRNMDYVYNFEVEKSHSYTAYNVAAKNCQWLNNPKPEDEQRLPAPRVYKRKPDLYTRNYVTVDPAVSQDEDADYTAIMACGIDPENDLYVLDYINQRLSPMETIDMIFKYDEWYKPITIGVEVVAYQQALVHFLEDEMKERRYLNIEELNPRKSSKHERIMGLQPRLANGAVLIKEHMNDLEDQIINFPFVDHDDLLDALAYQLMMIEAPPQQRNKPRPKRKRNEFTAY